MTVEQPAPKSLTFSDWLGNGLLFFTLLPYTSPIPLKSDIQLVAAAFAVLIILVKIFIDREPIKLGWSELGIFFMALVFLVYATPEAWKDSGDVLRKSSAMMLGFVIYLAAKLTYKSFSIKVVMAAAVCHLFGALLQQFNPSLHKTLVLPFLNMIRAGLARGIGGLCSEASFLANIAVFLPLIAWIVTGNGEKMTKKMWITLWVIVAALFALSQAATATIYGIVVLLVFGFSRGIKSSVKTILILATCSVVIMALGPMLPKTRATSLAEVAINNPRLVIEDPSASMRLVGHYLSGPSLIERPLGTGEVKLDEDYFWYLWNKYNIDSWYEVDVSRLSAQFYAIGDGLTDFGANCLRMGWIFVAMLAFWMFQYRGTRFSAVVIAFVALGVFSSIPIVFPGYWLLLGCVQAFRDREANREPSPETILQTR